MGGISISIRERDDLIEIWNARSDLHEQSTVIEKVKDLLPEVNFFAIFYKGMENGWTLTTVIISLVLPIYFLIAKMSIEW